MTLRKKVLLGTLAVAVPVLLFLHFLCSRKIYLQALRYPGEGTFQIEVSGVGFWSRCDMKVPSEQDFPLENCHGDHLDAEVLLNGMIQHLKVPCTLVRPRIRILRYDRVLHDGPVDPSGDWLAELHMLPPAPVLYCRGGDRTKDLAEKLAAEGMPVAFLEGGLLGWEAASLELDRPD